MTTEKLNRMSTAELKAYYRRIADDLDTKAHRVYYDKKSDSFEDECAEDVQDAATAAWDAIVDLIDMIPEMAPRVLDYDEIRWLDAVWLEVKHTNATELEVTAYKSHGDMMVTFEHGYYQSIRLYGKQWRCWSMKPTREQMEKEEWK